MIYLIAGVASFAATSLAVLLWFPIEALLLSRWGFTPGKWLLGIAVRDREGRLPTFRGAFRRVAMAWAYGLGCDTPFSVATAVLAYDNVKRNGAAYWDVVGGYQVRRRAVGRARAVVARLVLVLGLAIIIAGALSAYRLRF